MQKIPPPGSPPPNEPIPCKMETIPLLPSTPEQAQDAVVVREYYEKHPSEELKEEMHAALRDNELLEILVDGVLDSAA
jgi:hypothetical protein